MNCTEACGQQRGCGRRREAKREGAPARRRRGAHQPTPCATRRRCDTAVRTEVENSNTAAKRLRRERYLVRWWIVTLPPAMTASPRRTSACNGSVTGCGADVEQVMV